MYRQKLNYDDIVALIKDRLLTYINNLNEKMTLLTPKHLLHGQTIDPILLLSTNEDDLTYEGQTHLLVAYVERSKLINKAVKVWETEYLRALPPSNGFSLEIVICFRCVSICITIRPLPIFSRPECGKSSIMNKLFSRRCFKVELKYRNLRQKTEIVNKYWIDVNNRLLVELKHILDEHDVCEDTYGV